MMDVEGLRDRAAALTGLNTPDRLLLFVVVDFGERPSFVPRLMAATPPLFAR